MPPITRLGSNSHVAPGMLSSSSSTIGGATPNQVVFSSPLMNAAAIAELSLMKLITSRSAYGFGASK